MKDIEHLRNLFRQEISAQRQLRHTRGANVFVAVLLTASCSQTPDSTDNIVEFDESLVETAVTLEDARIINVNADSASIVLRTGTNAAWPGISISVPEKGRLFWNLSASAAVAVEIENLDPDALSVSLRLDNLPGTNGRLRPWVSAKTTIPGRQKGVLRTPLRRSGEVGAQLHGMQRYPQGTDPEGLDTDSVSRITVFVGRNETARNFRIGPIRTEGTYVPAAWEQLSVDEFFPFVDALGQFRHADWPGKAANAQDLHTQREQESQELQQIQAAVGTGTYGGWKEGPRLEASGQFRVQKRANKWWIVDPEGYLFWSHGIDVVRLTNATIVSNRQKYFVPPASEPDADTEFHSTTPGDDTITYDFAAANLFLKYGEDWQNLAIERIFARLADWRINTLGLWADRSIKAARRVPFVEWLHYDSPKIGGTGKDANKMVDMWHPDFAAKLHDSAESHSLVRNNPWLLGVFVDNELPWGDSIGFFALVLQSPAQQPAKIALVQQLRKKYQNINDLNNAWETAYSGWSSILESSIVPNAEKTRDDAYTFMVVAAERYYSTTSAIVAQEIPGTLYLCSRFNGRFPVPERAAAKYCDIVSYNLYRNSVRDFSAIDDLDVPILVSEWHFGATDRGVFGDGLVPVRNQKERGKQYRDYVAGALENPNIVGVHWFQYMDEPLTGRFIDGENHQIGFVSITDYPYSETTDASRDIGNKLYTLRSRSDLP